MKIANTLSALLMTFYLLALTAEPAHAAFDDYQRFRKGAYDFEFETRYFNTEANYNGSGDSFQKLSMGKSYEIYNAYLKTRYGLSRRSALYGNLNIANATSHGLDADRNNSSVPEARVGYAYRPYNEAFDTVLDFNVVIPFYKINENTDSALNNEGVIVATALLRLQKEISSLGLFGYVGGSFRQSRSSLLPWGVGVELSYPGWGWGGKIFGYQSLTEDPDTNHKTQRLIVVDRVNAGSLAYYSVNPSVVDSEVFAKFRFKNTWTLAVGGGTTITGANTAAGYHGGVSLAYTWDSEPSYYMKSSDQETGISSEKKVRKFKEEVDDGVNQNLFQKKLPPAPAH